MIGATAPGAVVIGSSVAEFTAARLSGLRLIGHTCASAVRRSPREAG
ncbi:hypothetical protein ABZS79_24750 [Streptomyces griseoloalbus]